MLNVCERLKHPLYEYQVASLLRLLEDVGADAHLNTGFSIERARELMKDIRDCRSGYWMTFAELEIGAKFICMPLAGDDHGHGGYRGEHYIFVKTAQATRAGKPNAHRLGKTRQTSDMTATMHVVPVG